MQNYENLLKMSPRNHGILNHYHQFNIFYLSYIIIMPIKHIKLKKML